MDWKWNCEGCWIARANDSSYLIQTKEDGLFHVEIDDTPIQTFQVFSMAKQFCAEHARLEVERKNHP